MYVLAVTGGIGSGKTTAARLLGDLGATVIDLDDLAKRLTGVDGPLVGEVTAAFGPGILGADGGVDHRALAKIAFESPESARKLDAIVHPGVYAAVAGALDMLLEVPEPPAVVVLDIPLLAEAPEFFDLVDGVLVVSADEDSRLARLVSRGMSEADVHARMACQVSDAERRDIADYVVENDGTVTKFESELAYFWDSELANRGS
ncbi:MAG TPA: dephospho-CoA kinase [Coriobacteriia bacterium]